MLLIWGKPKANYFCACILNASIGLNPLANLDFARNRFRTASVPTNDRTAK